MPFFILGGAILGGLAGDAMSWAGGQQTNAANEQINQEQIQASMDRQKDAEAFNAQQADLNRQFSAQQQAQAMSFNQGMSDTAMSRRVQDLKNAGINPLLAVSQGGASSPVMSGATSSAASISPGANPGQIPMQNTLGAFGNLGGILNSAIQVQTAQANIDNLKANTAKLQAEAGQEIPAQVANIKALTGLNNQQALQVQANINKIQQETMTSNTQEWATHIKTMMDVQDLQVKKATQDAIISSMNSDATAKALGLARLRNLNEYEKSDLGKVLDWIGQAATPITSAVGAARAIVP